MALLRLGQRLLARLIAAARVMMLRQSVALRPDGLRFKVVIFHGWIWFDVVVCRGVVEGDVF